MTPCPTCEDERLRAIADALAIDDLDRAMSLGLLDTLPAMDGVCTACEARLRIVTPARDDRLRALAARDRYRKREIRLAERARVRKRTAGAPQHAIATAPSLPPAAAAALARAKARIAAKPQPE